jgi:tRNA(His) 5'-end guanylyltransferase
MFSLGDRMKMYEKTFHPELMKRVPVIIRLDGKAFHTFTRNCDKPFDQYLSDTMIHAAFKVAKEIQGFKLAYIQSDEVSFLITDYDKLNTSPWFDYDLAKITSISASIMSANFNKIYNNERWMSGKEFTNNLAFFDSRAFNVPESDVVNYFLWRAKDWERNSIQMYAQANFSHKQLMNKNQKDMHEMLHNIGKNWTTDLTDQQKNGTFLLKGESGKIIPRVDIKPNYEEISKIFETVMKKVVDKSI